MAEEFQRTLNPRMEAGRFRIISSSHPILEVKASTIIANGTPIESHLPCSLEEFLLSQNLLPKSVVVEHNGEAVAPSEFSKRKLQAGDKLEIVKIVAGG